MRIKIGVVFEKSRIKCAIENGKKVVPAKRHWTTFFILCRYFGELQNYDALICITANTETVNIISSQYLSQHHSLGHLSKTDLKLVSDLTDRLSQKN